MGDLAKKGTPKESFPCIFMLGLMTSNSQKSMIGHTESQPGLCSGSLLWPFIFRDKVPLSSRDRKVTFPMRVLFKECQKTFPSFVTCFGENSGEGTSGTGGFQHVKVVYYFGVVWPKPI